MTQSKMMAKGKELSTRGVRSFRDIKERKLP